ncbi:MAG TPA: CDP-diacylglycerol--glycerol-3-phosphate 3-phosphatidyltransferase [Candidatus Limnocylindria bacterium]|nr:CDP-diacylglycerol--glycerol-3-phosphate 3-phosphatidyltransferase [Candidatus Limnocylindria bacterium]
MPNVLSFFRIVCVPLVIGLLVAPTTTTRRLAALLFLAASITDYLDGYLARRRGIVSTLGQFLDPLADKLLVAAVLVMLVAAPDGYRVPAWIVAVIIARELAVTGLRAIAMQRGLAVPADELGKYKMLTQIFALQGLLLAETVRVPLLGVEVDFYAAGMRFLWVALVLSVWSGLDYHWKVLRRIDLS